MRSCRMWTTRGRWRIKSSMISWTRWVRELWSCRRIRCSLRCRRIMMEQSGKERGCNRRWGKIGKCLLKLNKVEVIITIYRSRSINKRRRLIMQGPTAVSFRCRFSWSLVFCQDHLIHKINTFWIKTERIWTSCLAWPHRQRCNQPNPRNRRHRSSLANSSILPATTLHSDQPAEVSCLATNMSPADPATTESLHKHLAAHIQQWAPTDSCSFHLLYRIDA